MHNRILKFIFNIKNDSIINQKIRYTNCTVLMKVKRMRFYPY